MESQNNEQLEADLRAKLITNHLVNFIDAFGGDVLGFVEDVQVETGKDGEPEVLLTINGRRRRVSYNFLITTLKVF